MCVCSYDDISERYGRMAVTRSVQRRRTAAVRATRKQWTLIGKAPGDSRRAEPKVAQSSSQRSTAAVSALKKGMRAQPAHIME